MNATGMRHFGLMWAAATITVALVLPTVPATAGGASAWDKDTRSAIRLIAGARKTESGALRAGIEFKLGAGWKTYWRYPGDSGVPPRFDFARSDNLKSATVLWPAPHRIKDPSGTSIGYHDGLILPLVVVAKDPTKPVTLRLKLEYAVCEKLCVPAEGKAEIVLKGHASDFEAALAAAEALVPRAMKIGDDGPLSVRMVKRTTVDGKPHIVVDVTAPQAVDLFAEGPTADWALPLPEPVPGAPAGSQRFKFALDGLPPGVKPDGEALKLTATSGDRAIEVTTRLD